MSHILCVSIRPTYFSGTYLRIDGRGLTSPQPFGGGVVDWQDSVRTWEKLQIENHPEDDTFSIVSSAFPHVYLRMDGTEVLREGKTLENGGGIVNCQYSPGISRGPYEQFRFENQEDGSKAIASVAFPGVYLRMESNLVRDTDEGFGLANCQFGVGSHEKFTVTIL